MLSELRRVRSLGARVFDTHVMNAFLLDPFWQELLLSAADQLFDASTVTADIFDAVCGEMRAVKGNRGAVFF